MQSALDYMDSEFIREFQALDTWLGQNQRHRNETRATLLS